MSPIYTMMYLYVALSLTLSSTLSNSAPPLGMMVVILTFYLLTSLIINTQSLITMLVFLIYIGGLMVMFSYFLSTQPNTPMDSWPLLMSMTLNSLYLHNMSKPKNPITSHTNSPSYILHSTNLKLLLILTLSLLLALIIVNTLTMPTRSPLRPFHSTQLFYPHISKYK